MKNYKKGKTGLGKYKATGLINKTGARETYMEYGMKCAQDLLKGKKVKTAITDGNL